MRAPWVRLSILLPVLGVQGIESMAPIAIQLELSWGETRCVADTVRGNGTTTFEYKAIPVDGIVPEGLMYSVSSPNGVHDEDNELTVDIHTTSAPEGNGGTYELCFYNAQKKNARARVQLTETTVEPFEGPDDVQESPTMPVVEMLGVSKRVAESLIQEFKESSLVEIQRKADNETLRSRMDMLAMFTVAVLFSVSGWQLVLLNRFFRSKKLI